MRTARFSPDDRLIVTAAEDGTARLWLAQIGQYFGMLLVHRAAVNGASFGADAHSIVTASDDGTARLWTIPRAQPNDAATLADLAEAVSRQTIGNWGELVALPNRDNILARLRTHSTQQRASTSDLDRMLAELFSAHEAPPQQAAVHPSR